MCPAVGGDHPLKSSSAGRASVTPKVNLILCFAKGFGHRRTQSIPSRYADCALASLSCIPVETRCFISYTLDHGPTHREVSHSEHFHANATCGPDTPPVRKRRVTSRGTGRMTFGLAGHQEGAKGHAPAQGICETMSNSWDRKADFPLHQSPSFESNWAPRTRPLPSAREISPEPRNRQNPRACRSAGKDQRSKTLERISKQCMIA